MVYPKISVIVPIYNTEKYLNKCIESILNQTYKNLEIILVNDGSVDGCARLVNEYVKRDARVISIHKVNGGVGSARNAGLQRATGDYIGFVDSDDWIEVNMYQTLIEAMSGQVLDMVICGYFIDDGEIQKRVENKQKVNEEIFNRQELLKYVFQRDRYKGMAAYSWNKIFRKEILFHEGQPIQYNENYQIGEDVIWFSQIGVRSEKVRYIDEAFYHYVQRAESAVHSQQLAKQMQRIEVYQKVIEILQDNMVDEITIIYVKRFCAYHAMNIAKMAHVQKDEKVLEDMQKIMELNKKEYTLTNTDYPDRVEEYERVLRLNIVL